MGLFGKKRDKENSADNIVVQSINSRYTTEVLVAAYDNSRWVELREREYSGNIIDIPKKLPAEKYAELNFMINNFDYDIDVYFHLPKEQADTLLKDLFTVLPLLDTYIQDEAPDSGIDNYVIAYLDVYGDMVEIEYYGVRVNTQFDAKVFIDNGLWYCSKISMRKFEPPVSLYDLAKQGRM